MKAQTETLENWKIPTPEQIDQIRNTLPKHLHKHIDKTKNNISDNVDRAIAFFIGRFNRTPSKDLGYFLEWLNRIDLGHPIGYMDTKSLRVWQRVTVLDEFGLLTKRLKPKVLETKKEKVYEASEYTQEWDDSED